MTVLTPTALAPHAHTGEAEPQATARQRQVAQQFEAVFLRQILKGLESSGGLTGESSGAGVYRSMMVGALAENISESGGIGLSEIIFRAMLPPSGEKSADLLPGATDRTDAEASPGSLKPLDEGES